MPCLLLICATFSIFVLVNVLPIWLQLKLLNLKDQYTHILQSIVISDFCCSIERSVVKGLQKVFWGQVSFIWIKVLSTNGVLWCTDKCPCDMWFWTISIKLTLFHCLLLLETSVHPQDFGHMPARADTAQKGGSYLPKTQPSLQLILVIDILLAAIKTLRGCD